MPKGDIEIVQGRPTRVRYFTVGLIFITVVISYLDRSSLSIAGPFISRGLHLSSVQMGLVFSAFAWAYSPLQIPGAMLVDRLKPRLLYPAVIFVWSAMQFAIGTAGSLGQLFVLRMGLGGAEAPSFPMNNRIVTSWLPERERARGVGFFVSGQYVGLAFLTPLLAFVTQNFGWRAMFMLIGGLGMIWAICFRLLYRDPAASRRANAAELALIRAGGAVDWAQPARHGCRRACSRMAGFS